MFIAVRLADIPKSINARSTGYIVAAEVDRSSWVAVASAASVVAEVDPGEEEAPVVAGLSAVFEKTKKAAG